VLHLQFRALAELHKKRKQLLPEVSLISKQVISYQTLGDTDYSEGSTPKNQSLVDPSKTNNKP
jgi:hypothetical protein